MWKDGVITNASAKLELLPGKTVQVQSMQDIIGGAAYFVDQTEKNASAAAD